MNEKVVILILVVLLTLTVIAVLFYNLKKKKTISKVIYGSSESATKYREISFDREAGMSILQADVYFTKRNKCPIVFRCSDGRAISADVHFSYAIQETKFELKREISRIEFQARKILKDELEKQTKKLIVEEISELSFAHINAVRANFTSRMNKFVEGVYYLFLIEKMQLFIDPDSNNTENTLIELEQ